MDVTWATETRCVETFSRMVAIICHLRHRTAGEWREYFSGKNGNKVGHDKPLKKWSNFWDLHLDHAVLRLGNSVISHDGACVGTQLVMGVTSTQQFGKLGDGSWASTSHFFASWLCSARGSRRRFCEVVFWCLQLTLYGWLCSPTFLWPTWSMI